MTKAKAKEKTIHCSKCHAVNAADASFCFACSCPTKAEKKPKRVKVPPPPPAAMAGVRRDAFGDRLDAVTPPEPEPEPAPAPAPEPAPELLPSPTFGEPPASGARATKAKKATKKAAKKAKRSAKKSRR